LAGSARLRLAVEEHGAGKQQLRWRIWPHVSSWMVVLMAVIAALVGGAVLDHAYVAAAVMSIAIGVMLLRMAVDCGLALGVVHAAIVQVKAPGAEPAILRTAD
jgi:hypothetical protein